MLFSVSYTILSYVYRALGAGSKKPLLVRPVDTVFADADLCALLGALHAVYVVSGSLQFNIEPIEFISSF